MKDTRLGTRGQMSSDRRLPWHRCEATPQHLAIAGQTQIDIDAE